ncbi:unnamed protein product [Amoebophrya sp. A120]|nr:unnamed protein product [Amoebophrya sp. A120]|eukprot:GSA120T00010679001.1
MTTSYTINASGFASHLSPLNGSYDQLPGNNHGKLQWRRETTGIEGCDASCIYFWDDRDGEAMSGWWVAPVVGGEQVWAFNPSKDQKPPASGWRVPWHEATPDPAVKLLLSPAGAKRPGMEATDAPQAKVQKTEGSPPVVPSAVHPTVALRQQKTLQNLEQQVGNIEKAVEKALEADKNSADAQRAVQVANNALASTKKFIEAQQKQAFTGDQEVKLDPIKDRVSKAEEQLAAREKECADALEKKFEALKTEMEPRLKELVADLEAHVEQTKDETVLLTCELGEHSSPDDIVAIDEKVVITEAAARKAMAGFKDYIGDLNATFRVLGEEKAKELKPLIEERQKAADQLIKDLNEVKRTIAAPIAKAKKEIQRKKDEEERKRKAEEQERVRREAQKKSLRANEIGMFADYLVKKSASISAADVTLKSIANTQSEVLGLYDILQADLDHPDTNMSGGLKGTLTKALNRVRKNLSSLNLKEKEVREKSQEEDEKFAVFLSNAIHARLAEDGKSKEDLFKAISEGADTITYEQAIRFFVDDLLAGGGNENIMLLKKYLPSAWRKAVTSLQRHEKALQNKPDATWSEEQRAQAQATIMDYQATEDAAVQEKLSIQEFALFIMAAHYMCINPCDVTASKESVVPKKDDPEDAVGKLEADDVVRVINGPETVIFQPLGQAPYEVMRVEVTRVRDGLQGWVNIREPKNSFDNLEKYSNGYEIKQETVITNTYELKGFKVIRRVKKDEKMLAVSTPEWHKEAELLRMKVRAMIDGQEGWVTMKGSHGTMFVQSLAVLQAKQSGGQAGALNLLKDEETGKMYILQEGEAKTRITGKEWTDEMLQKELGVLATELPKACESKVIAVQSVKQECEQVLQKLKQMNSQCKLEDVNVEKILGANAESDDSNTKSDNDTVMHPEFDKDFKTLIEKCDNHLRKVNSEVGMIRQEMQLYFGDLQSVKASDQIMKYLRELKTPDLLKYHSYAEEDNKSAAAAPADKDGDVEMKDGENQDVEMKEPNRPNEADMDPMLRLKYRLFLVQKHVDSLVEFMRNTQSSKLENKEQLNKKFVAYKKGLELREFKQIASVVKKEVAEKDAKVTSLESIKKKLYTDITGEEPEVPTSKDDKEKEGEAAADADDSSPNKKAINQKPVHSAKQLCELGIHFEEKVNELDHFLNDIELWSKENDPAKFLQNKEQFKLLTNTEKAQVVQSCLPSYSSLKQRMFKSKHGVQVDRTYLKENLESDILLRSRTEIATFFRENDPVELFEQKLKQLNPENEKLEKDKQWISCEIVCNFMQEAMSDPIPPAIIKKIYSVLVGNDKRPMSCDEFSNLFAKMHYRCTKPTIMTEGQSLAGKFQKVCRLQAGDIVRLIGDVKKSEDMVRFEAETVPSPTDEDQTLKRGWVTLHGARGGTFFVLHTPGYVVIKQTVLTDIFEMKAFRPVVRLTVGDQVRAIAFPRKEATSGLIRVKAVTVGHKSGKDYTGFVTVEGNQNSVYLETCEALIFPDDKKPDGTAAKPTAARLSTASAKKEEPAKVELSKSSVEPEGAKKEL